MAAQEHQPPSYISLLDLDYNDYDGYHQNPIIVSDSDSSEASDDAHADISHYLGREALPPNRHTIQNLPQTDEHEVIDLDADENITRWLQQEEELVNPAYRDNSQNAEFDVIDLEADDSQPVVWHDALLAEHMREQEQNLSSPDACLARILEFFPDISPEFVRKTYHEKFQMFTHGPMSFDATLDHIVALDGKFPKQKDSQRAVEAGSIPTTNNVNKLPLTKEALSAARVALAADFPTVPKKTIDEALRQKLNVYDAYLFLTENLEKDQSYTTGHNKLKRPRPNDDRLPVSVSTEAGPHFIDLQNARAVRARLDNDRKSQAQRVEQEKENEAKARETGEIGECQCCFGDVPLNRVAYCSGAEPHLFCWDCTRTHTETGFGQGKSRPKCMDQSGCQAEFMDNQLRLCLPEASLSRLLRLQQQESLKAAAIDGLEECPFCDFMDVCPPVEADREFRCKMLECGKITCRLCKDETHVPLSCQEAKEKRERDRKLDARHFVEEAMTAALVRECNKCKNRFVKIEGCNKMHCTKCGNLQCYVCSANVRDYSHFSQRPGDDKCPTHDNFSVERRHHDEVQKAEKEARAKIQAENPDIDAEDLALKVSKAVEKEEQAKLDRGQDYDRMAQGQAFAMERIRMPHAPIIEPPRPLPFVGRPHVRQREPQPAVYNGPDQVRQIQEVATGRAQHLEQLNRARLERARHEVAMLERLQQDNLARLQKARQDNLATLRENELRERLRQTEAQNHQPMADFLGQQLQPPPAIQPEQSQPTAYPPARNPYGLLGENAMFQRHPRDFGMPFPIQPTQPPRPPPLFGPNQGPTHLNGFLGGNGAVLPHPWGFMNGIPQEANGGVWHLHANLQNPFHTNHGMFGFNVATGMPNADVPERYLPPHEAGNAAQK